MKQREPGFIEIEDFVEIFLAENQTNIGCLGGRKYEKLFKEFAGGEGEQITGESLKLRAEDVGIDLTEREAGDIVRYCSRTNKPELDKYDFIDILKSTSE